MQALRGLSLARARPCIYWGQHRDNPRPGQARPFVSPSMIVFSCSIEPGFLLYRRLQPTRYRIYMWMIWRSSYLVTALLYLSSSSSYLVAFLLLVFLLVSLPHFYNLFSYTVVMYVYIFEIGCPTWSVEVIVKSENHGHQPQWSFIWAIHVPDLTFDWIKPPNLNEFLDNEDD